MGSELIHGSSCEGSAEGVVLVENYHPYLPEGEYELRYFYHETAQQWGGPKMIIHFAVIAPEDYAGIEIARYYNVRKLVGPPRKYGSCRAGGRCYLVLDLRKLCGKLERLDRLTPARLKGKRIRARLATVRKDGQGQPLDESGYYTKVDKLLGIIPNDD